MSDAYLPGLTVSEATIIRKVRRLPLKGEVLVERGMRVEPETVVARTFIPGRPHLVPVANLLNIEPAEVEEVMLKAVGDPVEEGEVIARYSAFFGLFRGQCQSPAAGTIEHISPVTGQVTIREPAVPVAVKAYISGVVTEILPREGVVVETPAALAQGIFGIGGEGCGRLRMAVKQPDEVLTARHIRDDDRGRILVGGALVTAEALRRAEEAGVTGLVCGGILDKDLHEYLGYEIGVAITGHEDISLSLVVTEGFGKLPMAAKTFALFQKLEGQTASINGTTQIRAGVLRPEVVVSRPGIAAAETETVATGLEIGTRVRVIRTPWFGRLGVVSALPVQLQKIESEARVRVLEVTLDTGQRVTVPRANVEILAE
ncbi:MAG TPA: hypothetical protein PLL81_01110 [Bacillota bacterium]|nr:hypothetical protein [Bacillota bacterium]HQE01343.1 hypothetical protein [Bacillota bacterium]